jgi:2-methylcitrate dehydratase PrpD
MAYCIAAVIVRGGYDAEMFREEALQDHRIAELAKRVKYVPRDFGQSSFPGVVEIDLDDETLTAEVLFHDGSPERPMRAAGVLRKFHHNVDSVVGAQAAKQLEEAVLGLERLNDVTPITKLFAATKVEVLA